MHVLLALCQQTKSHSPALSQHSANTMSSFASDTISSHLSAILNVQFILVISAAHCSLHVTISLNAPDLPIGRTQQEKQERGSSDRGEDETQGEASVSQTC